MKCDYENYNPHKKKQSVNRTDIVRIMHAVILGLANTLPGTAEHPKMSSIKQGVCEGEVENYF